MMTWLTRTTTKTPTARTAIIFDTTTNLWSDAFLAVRGGVISMTLTTTTTDNNGNNDDVIVAFLIGTGG